MELARDFYVGIVEDNKDPNRKGRIKVRVQTLYHNIALEDIPYAYPWGGISGKDFQVPAIGKLVNILFLSDDLYSPYYIYSENYNVNLQNKLKDLSEDEYTNFVALLVDERTNLFVDSKELTIDHLYNKMTINNNSINLELKDSTQKLNLGTKDSTQDAVLGTNFFDWMDKFIAELLNPGSLVGNLGAPIMKPKLQKLCLEYQSKRKNFTSEHVKIVDNKAVQKLERIPTTINTKNDTDLVIPPDINEANRKALNDAIKSSNDKACDTLKDAAPTSFVESDTEMVLPLVGTRISSRFGLRQDPTNPSKTQGHGGIDIAAPIGTPIVSPADGSVIASGFDDKHGGGNYLRIKHTNNFITGYAHLSTGLVSKGDTVKQGEKIALVGNSGAHTTGSHLHFTVTTPNNEKIDPEDYFNWPSSDQTNNSKNYQGQDYNIPDESKCKGAATETEKDPNIDGSPLSTEFDNPTFTEMTIKVIEKLEGGYFHPDMVSDGRIKDKRYKGSGETMFGIDRKTGGKINSSTAGKKFWNIIDNANARKTWKWNYFGGNLKNTLLPLAAEMMKPQFDDYSNRYLSKKSLEIVNSDNKILFHFIYATWNGSGWFRKFANPFNDAVEKGITDIKKLRRLVLDTRKNDKNSLIAQTGTKIEKLFDSNFT
jgi:murein DD-endopeptidase MepM/ murein hydrolase activator NlpD